MRYYRVSPLSPTPTPDLPTVHDIVRAREIITPFLHPTNLERSDFFTRRAGAQNVWLTTEHLQKTGSFKIRGALHKITQLSPEERGKGVITASAGNHAQGVALAASVCGVSSTVIMPRNVPKAKMQATRAYGATCELYGETYEDAVQHAHEREKDENFVFIHAFDDAAVIAGQGTLGLEILEQGEKNGLDIEMLLVPVGGGGLIAGIAIAVKETRPEIQIIGVQAEGCAAALEALQNKKRVLLPKEEAKTLADGIRVRQIGALPFAIMQKYVDGVIAVSEPHIIEAMFTLQERCKFVVEGAGAVSVAPFLHPEAFKELLFAKKHLVAVLSGGNVDMDKVGDMIETALVQENRTAVFKVTMKETPDAFLSLFQTLYALGVNIRHVSQTHVSRRWPGHEIEVMVTLETQDKEHLDTTAKALEKQHYEVRQIVKPFLV